MSTSPMRRLLTAALISAGTSGLFATGVQANSSTTVEPVFMAGGFTPACNPSSDMVHAFRDGLTLPLPADPGVPAVPATSIKSWALDGPLNETYQMCSDMSIPYLAQNFVRALRRFRNAEIKKNPSVTKIDVIGVSLGSTISRYCIKYNPLGGSPSCAQMIDDWVGIAPPSHGSTTFTAAGCATTAMYEKICRAAIPGSIVMDQLNESGDETPYGWDDPGGHIEYTTVWSENDGTIIPATSSLLDGAASRRVINGFVNNVAAGAPLTHATVMSQPACPGGPSNGPASGEWVAWELRDAIPRPVLASDGYIDCAYDGRDQY